MKFTNWRWMKNEKQGKEVIKMKKKVAMASDKEAKRLEQVEFVMDHWDELPERLQGHFEGILAVVNDFTNVQPNGPRRAG